MTREEKKNAFLLRYFMGREHGHAPWRPFRFFGVRLAAFLNVWEEASGLSSSLCERHAYLAMIAFKGSASAHIETGTKTTLPLEAYRFLNVMRRTKLPHAVAPAFSMLLWNAPQMDPLKAFRLAGLALKSFEDALPYDAAHREFLEGIPALDFAQVRRLQVLEIVTPVFVDLGKQIAPRQPLVVFNALWALDSALLAKSVVQGPKILSLLPNLVGSLADAGTPRGKAAAVKTALKVCARPDLFTPPVISRAIERAQGAMP